jgi:hypothetical protein
MSPEGIDEHQQSSGEHDQERAYTQRPVWTSPTSEKGRGGSSVRKIHWEVKKYSKGGRGNAVLAVATRWREKVHKGGDRH